jgi:hypothetical protein
MNEAHPIVLVSDYGLGNRVRPLWTVLILINGLLGILCHITGTRRAAFYTIGMESAQYPASHAHTISRGGTLLVFVPLVDHKLQYYNQ